jgi:hypothetical protein
VYLFDLLYRDRRDLRPLPSIERRGARSSHESCRGWMRRKRKRSRPRTPTSPEHSQSRAPSAARIALSARHAAPASRSSRRRRERSGWSRGGEKRDRGVGFYFSRRAQWRDSEVQRSKPLRRDLVERFFCELKQYRAISMRCDKLANTFLAAAALVCVLFWLN